MTEKRKPTPEVPYPCSECGRNAFIRYSWKRGGWGGLVKKGEHLCTKCFEARGGKRMF